VTDSSSKAPTSDLFLLYSLIKVVPPFCRALHAVPKYPNCKEEAVRDRSRQQQSNRAVQLIKNPESL